MQSIQKNMLARQPHRLTERTVARHLLDVYHEKIVRCERDVGLVIQYRYRHRVLTFERSVQLLQNEIGRIRRANVAYCERDLIVVARVVMVPHFADRCRVLVTTIERFAGLQRQKSLEQYGQFGAEGYGWFYLLIVTLHSAVCEVIEIEVMRAEAPYPLVSYHIPIIVEIIHEFVRRNVLQLVVKLCE